MTLLCVTVGQTELTKTARFWRDHFETFFLLLLLLLLLDRRCTESPVCKMNVSGRLLQFLPAALEFGV